MSEKRGEAAWKQAKEEIAERNAATRKAGRERRAAYERDRAASRRAGEARQMRDLGRAP